MGTMPLANNPPIVVAFRPSQVRRESGAILRPLRAIEPEQSFAQPTLLAESFGIAARLAISSSRSAVRPASVILDRRNAILYQRDFLIIDEFRQLAVLKVTKQLDIAQPDSVVRAAQMGATNATQGAFGQ
jgi:hypothetical protein